MLSQVLSSSTDQSVRDADIVRMEEEMTNRAENDDKLPPQTNKYILLLKH